MGHRMTASLRDERTRCSFLPPRARNETYWRKAISSTKTRRVRGRKRDCGHSDRCKRCIRPSEGNVRGGCYTADTKGKCSREAFKGVLKCSPAPTFVALRSLDLSAATPAHLLPAAAFKRSSSARRSRSLPLTSSRRRRALSTSRFTRSRKSTYRNGRGGRGRLKSCPFSASLSVGAARRGR